MVNSQSAPTSALLQSPDRRRWLAGGSALALGSCLPACSQPVSLFRVGAIVFPGYELMFLAREQGWLDPRKIRLVEMKANTDTLRSLAAGQLEAAALTLDEMMSARADGVDLRAVMVVDISHGADVVMARRGISLDHLRGKRVAVEEGAMGAVMLTSLLRAAQLRVEEIRKIPMTLDRSLEVFAAGKVDAVVTAEPWATQLEARGAQRIFDSSRIPGRIVDVLAVRADVLDTHGAAVRSLVQAHFRARRLFVDRPQDVAPLMAARLQTAPADVQAAYLGLKLPDLADNRKLLQPGGQFFRTALELQRVMVESGLLTQQSRPAELADIRFISA
jgi:NitT/TauT family transport system substrate-binding protein